MQIDVSADPAGLARKAAERIGTWLRAEGHPTLGLAGGSTPRLTYELLRSQDAPWSRTHVWLTDERHVPLDHPQSNGGMALESLLDHIPARFHPVEHRRDPAVTASGYEHTLHEMWHEVDRKRGSGLVLLGIGDDGHTASLFPDTTALSETEHDYVANWVDEKSTWRLTATPPLLAKADRLMFLVAGEAKAKVVAEIVEGGSDHPAAIVSDAAKDPVWMLDRAAASRLG
jgi:6-phosphogluconolactonase